MSTFCPIIWQTWIRAQVTQWRAADCCWHSKHGYIIECLWLYNMTVIDVMNRVNKGRWNKSKKASPCLIYAIIVEIMYELYVHPFTLIHIQGIIICRVIIRKKVTMQMIQNVCVPWQLTLYFELCWRYYDIFMWLFYLIANHDAVNGSRCLWQAYVSVFVFNL